MQSSYKSGQRLGAIAAATVMLAAFGGAEAMAASPRAAENKVVLVARQDPGTLDYVTSNLTALRLWIPANVVEPLVYFNKDGNVDRLANYTLKDGVPFDMISRTTPTGGVEQTFLGQLLKGGTDPNAAIRNALANNNQ